MELQSVRIKCACFDENQAYIHGSSLNHISHSSPQSLRTGYELSESDEVLQILFSLMLVEETYTKAITLMENILIFRKSTLQLNTIRK